MADTTVGVGAALAVALVVLGLGTAGLALAELPARAALLVVAAEVGAKAGVAALVCLDSAAHEGFGSAFASRSPPRAALAPALVALPVVLLAPPVGTVALLAAAAAALAVRRWSLRNLDGISGDVLGATNELARVAALHAGAVAWRAVESGTPIAADAAEAAAYAWGMIA